MTAFAVDPATPAAWKRRLRCAVAEERLLQRPLHADADGASFVATLLDGSTDLDDWQAAGLPRWLALAVDGILAELPSRADAASAGWHVLDALAPGAELDTAGSALILAMLADSLPVDAALPEALREAGAQLEALHRDCLAGGEVATARWRSLRRQATALTDGLPPGLPMLAARCLESASWDPRQSRAAVLDTLRAWAGVRTELALRAWGWSEVDEARIRALLAEVHGRAVDAGADPSRLDTFALLREAYPREEERLRTKITRERELRPRQWSRALALLVGELRRRQPPLSRQRAPVPAPLLPRADLFADPDRTLPRISPDGCWLAWLAAGDGAMNLWAAPLEAPAQARQLSFDTHRGIAGYRWSHRPGTLLFMQDRDGDENWRLHAVSVEGGPVRPLTPDGGVRAGIAAVSPRRPDHILVSLNERDPRWPDLYLLDLDSGELRLHQHNAGMARFVVDDDYAVRLAVRTLPDGGNEVLRPDADGQWQPWIVFDAADARVSGPSHFDAEGRHLYLYDSRGRDTAALLALDPDGDGQGRLIAADPLAEPGRLLTHAGDHHPSAFSLAWLRPGWLAMDAETLADVEHLEVRLPGDWSVVGRDQADRLWLLQSGDDLRPGSYWLYRRDGRQLRRLYDRRPALAGKPLARMQPLLLRSRDGLDLVAYLSLPVEADAGNGRAHVPLPLVLLVHGGPWTRDGFGYSADHQWLANRGYAVLSVNFRGSAGFGKEFLAAGDGEWGRKMDEDLDDAVQWAVEQGIADPARLAIFGGSYGGYAVLSALTRHPRRYACGIDLFGPSDLQTLLAAIPPYWEAAKAMQYRAIGNPETAQGRALLHERSPLHRAGAIRTPLLVAQGGNDPRVRQGESERMVAALRGNGIAVDYALFPDEGHGFVREANRMAFNALAEDFLARHLGGRCEPLPDGGFPGSSLVLTR